GELPIIAEDLGVITPGVEELRDGFGLPGMKILQFAFDTPCGENPFLPHHYIPNCVVYTGTHDNNTTVGWWRSGEADEYSRQCMCGYLNRNEKSIVEPHWELIRLGMMSVAHTFIIPMQDILGYGADTRMNTPGRSAGNWSWRFEAKELDNPIRERLAGLTQLYSRAPEEEDEEETAETIVGQNA
ncbi:MAG: 4-alpha-glucanotransferase, partial [Burkholderiales bacterium]|nr:4-alpha-glucanotransferase [Anaerolineae bacterium]